MNEDTTAAPDKKSNKIKWHELKNNFKWHFGDSKILLFT